MSIMRETIELPPDATYMLVYEDNDCPAETFTGPGSHLAAWQRYQQVGENWNAHLFAMIHSNVPFGDDPVELVSDRQEVVFQPHWPHGLEQGVCFELPCDDKGCNGKSFLRVMIAPDGDAHLMMQDWEDYPEGQPSPLPTLRNRTFAGGGRHNRTHQALLWLAQAIRLDNEEIKGRRKPHGSDHPP